MMEGRLYVSSVTVDEMICDEHTPGYKLKCTSSEIWGKDIQEDCHCQAAVATSAELRCQLGVIRLALRQSTDLTSTSPPLCITKLPSACFKLSSQSCRACLGGTRPSAFNDWLPLGHNSIYLSIQSQAEPVPSSRYARAETLA